ncbi:MAG: hypothetical protein R3A11_09825 [Bdellovibrionota bacterium]
MTKTVFLTGAQAFWDRLAVRGPNLSLSQCLGSKLEMSLGWGLFSDGVWPRIFGSQDSIQRTRNVSHELSAEIRYEPNPFVFFRTKAFQEIVSHQGQYMEIELNHALGIIPGKKGQAPLVIFRLSHEFGLGSDSHNQYLYGIGDGGGWTNYRLGIEAISFRMIPGTFVLFRQSYHRVLQDRLAGAALSTGRDFWQSFLLLSYRLR